MKVSLIGFGAVGRIIALRLLRYTDVDEIRLCDKAFGRIRQAAERLKSNKVSIHQVDARDINQLVKVAKGVDVLVNALEPIFNMNLLEAALRAGANYQDMAFGPPYNNLQKMLAQNGNFEDADLAAVTATGNTPGITNIVASNGIEYLDNVDEIKIRVASTLDAKKYISTWSPATLIQDMKEEPVIFIKGRFEKVPPFSGEEVYKFPEPLNFRTITHHAHEEPYTLGRFIGKGLKYVEFKYGLDPFMKYLYQIGLLNEQPVDIRGVKVAPVDLVIQVFPPPVKEEEVHRLINDGTITGSIGFVVIEITGERNSEKAKRIYTYRYPDIIEIQKEYPGATHTSYMAGVSAALIVKMIGMRKIRKRGVYPPECIDAEARHAFINELAKSGVSIQLLPSNNVPNTKQDRGFTP